MSVADLHSNFAWVMVAMTALAGAWSLVAHRRPSADVSALGPVLTVSHATVGIQVLLGVIAYQADETAISRFHMFYGFLAFASVFIMVNYRNQLQQWRHLIDGFGSLFIMGLGLRAIFLG